MLCSLWTVDVTLCACVCVCVHACARVTQVIVGSAALLLISLLKENETLKRSGASVLPNTTNQPSTDRNVCVHEYAPVKSAIKC